MSERGLSHDGAGRGKHATLLSRAKAGLAAGWAEGTLTQAIIVLLVLNLFVYLWAVPMLMLDLVPPWGRGMGGLLLALQGIIVGLWLVREAGARGAAAAAAILSLSYVVEFVGVRTGSPFGRYEYTPILGLQLGGAVPLAIPFAWLMVVPGAMMTVRALGRSALVVLFAALLALLLDLLIEPVAAYVTGYWRWLDQGPYYGVPTSNFVAWGATALALLAILHLLAPKLHHVARTPWLPPLLFWLNVGQFTLVNAAYGFWWAFLVGAGLLLGLWLLRGYVISGRAMEGKL